MGERDDGVTSRITPESHSQPLTDYVSTTRSVIYPEEKGWVQDLVSLYIRILYSESLRFLNGTNNCSSTIICYVEYRDPFI